MNVIDPKGAPEDQSELVMIALTILGEAENQPWAGKVGVGKVITNRMRLKKQSAIDVCLAKWQFDCWDPGTNRRDFLLTTIQKAATNLLAGLWEECLQAAEVAMDVKSEDPTKGATHYVVEEEWGVDDAKRKRPRWHSKQCIENGVTTFLAQIGKHIFALTP